MTDPVISITIHLPTAVAHKISETAPGTLEETALIALRLYHGLGLPARTALTELAEHHNLTPAKTLRLAVEHFKKDTERLKLGKSVAGRPVVNSDRDAEIYARTRTGVTHATVAAEFNISLVRIGQIVAKQRAMRNEPVPTNAKPATKALQLLLEMEAGTAPATVAQRYGMTEDAVCDAYAAYKAKLPARPNMLDRMNAARVAEPVEPEGVLTLKVSPPAQPTMPTTPDTQSAPRKLAVIPPSMRNPELFPVLKEIKPVDFDNLDNRIFDDFEL